MEWLIPCFIASHGDGCESCSHLVFFACGPDFRKGYTTQVTRQQPDITATIAYLLSFKLEDCKGEVMKELFVRPRNEIGNKGNFSNNNNNDNIFTPKISLPEADGQYSITNIPARSRRAIRNKKQKKKERPEYRATTDNLSQPETPTRRPDNN